MRKVISICLSLALVFALATPVFAAETKTAGNEGNVVFFTNEDFLNAARSAYSAGLITEDDWNFVLTELSARVGVKGENKIVTVDDETIDVYLNNVLWSTVVALGTGASAAIIAAIPGLNAIAAAVIAAAVGGASESLLSAENGVIIRLRWVDISGGIGLPEYTYAVESISEQ